MRLSASVLVLLLPLAAAAGPFDGLYRPNYDWAKAWDCKSIGQKEGALSVKDGRLEAAGTACVLTDPVEVTGMEAVLYNAACTGETGETEGRVMLMRHEFGIYVIRDGLVLDWIGCEAG